jgi:hypothetical protein
MAAAETLMWEVRCPPGQSKALVEWIRAEVMPGFWDDESVALWNVYRSTGQEDGDRVVLVVDYVGRAAAGAAVPEPPAEMVARPAHQWVFERLDM